MDSSRRSALGTGGLPRDFFLDLFFGTFFLHYFICTGKSLTFGLLFRTSITPRLNMAMKPPGMRLSVGACGHSQPECRASEKPNVLFGHLGETHKRTMRFPLAEGRAFESSHAPTVSFRAVSLFFELERIKQWTRNKNTPN
jgi:hypothetical protein